MNKWFVGPFTFLAMLCVAYGQTRDTSAQYFTPGLSVSIGPSHVAVKDEFISGEKYSGSGNSYLIQWAKLHQTYFYELRFEGISGATIKNNLMNAELSDFSLEMAYAYPVGNSTLFGKPLSLWAGPVPGLYFHYRAEDIGRGGSTQMDAYSFAVLFSAGAKVYAFLPVNDRFTAKGELSTTVVSLGAKFIDPEDKSKSMVKLLTLFSGMRLSMLYSMQYKISDLFSASIGYRFNLTRITAWDPLVLGSDNIFVSANVDF